MEVKSGHEVNLEDDLVRCWYDIFRTKDGSTAKAGHFVKRKYEVVQSTPQGHGENGVITPCSL